ncbi:MAG TPA: hypothetical protein VN816_09385 [Acidimicrobiales bacterium]|nr:hypothetical protein [Acidimicrobiales bacterium]
MSDAPDPLGKRALYWAPAERYEEGPRNPDGGDVPGKHALFSDVGSVTMSTGGRPRTRSSDFDRAGAGRDGHPSNRRPPGSAAEQPVPRRPARPDQLERPVGSGMFGSLTLQCSSCRVRSQVDLVEYIVLHLPLWLWRPGRGYTRFMTCPACRRRTWVSASWTSWTR